VQRSRGAHAQVAAVGGAARPGRETA
jgi:hypothetical protein